MYLLQFALVYDTIDSKGEKTAKTLKSTDAEGNKFVAGPRVSGSMAMPVAQGPQK